MFCNFSAPKPRRNGERLPTITRKVGNSETCWALWVISSLPSRSQVRVEAFITTIKASTLSSWWHCVMPAIGSYGWMSAAMAGNIPFLTDCHALTLFSLQYYITYLLFPGATAFSQKSNSGDIGNFDNV